VPDQPGHDIALTVNGESRHFRVEARTLLVRLLRDACGLTGTKVGCDTTQCGACTVLVDGRAEKSCTLLAVRLDGAEITTIEGLAKPGEMHPVQAAFAEKHGLQCGFCTPGMILTTLDLLQRDSDPSEATVRHALAGNLCRCTGYHTIVDSVQAAAAAQRGAST
jgi:aerobic carbon-monoxide dehydrogenase small subunit